VIGAEKKSGLLAAVIERARILGHIEAAEWCGPEEVKTGK
jgi:hypothetical protein